MENPNKPKERLDQIDKVLDEYESNLGLGSYAGDFHDQSVKQFITWRFLFLSTKVLQ